ncbi:MAG: DinB family protein [Sphingobacteriales bacterium]|nr:DinB family protein [Sphingobacteriales bacterium]
MMRPLPSDYSPFSETYVSLVETGDIKKMMTDSLPAMSAFLSTITEEKADYAYASGKWTVKQLLQHTIDTEKVFAYRAMCFARGEKQPLPGFDQDDYAAHVDVSGRSLAGLKEEMLLARKLTIMLFEPLSDEALNERGVASDHDVTVLALGYILLGHWRHHESILKGKYGL